MSEKKKTEESTGATRHFLYYIFQWDRKEHPMPLPKAAELLQYLQQVFAEKNQQKGRN